MKKLFLITVLVTAALSASAQRGLFEFGIKGGITSQNTEFGNSIANISSDKFYHLSTSRKTGYHVGIVGRINLAMIHIQPELIYSYNRYQLTSMYVDTAISSIGAKQRSTIRMSTVEMPILAGIKLLWFRFQAGPMLTLSTDTSVNDSGDANHSVTLNKPTLSYLLGVGFDMSKFSIDVRYNGQFKRPEQNTQIGNDFSFERKMRINSWMFSLGYMF